MTRCGRGRRRLRYPAGGGGGRPAAAIRCDGRVARRRRLFGRGTGSGVGGRWWCRCAQGRRARGCASAVGPPRYRRCQRGHLAGTVAGSRHCGRGQAHGLSSLSLPFTFSFPPFSLFSSLFFSSPFSIVSRLSFFLLSPSFFQYIFLRILVLDTK
ncbi:hypothetical protein BC828DRAFT_6294 [Blastocladiella britannica]|nr:hypothetical protein BC828DRAFT_6294 [Blastocladiella britannica]